MSPAPPFDLAVEPGGYAWWYLDALSDDGRFGLTIIAFLGSVFSPYYAHARHAAADDRADPLAHCAINVALYRLEGRGKRWTMTERGSAQVARTATRLAIGPSALAWDDTDGQTTLRYTLDEVTMPIPMRVRGLIAVETGARPTHEARLDDAGHHRWSVIAPCARVTVDLASPDQHWSGPAYVDSNRGTVPLERDFVSWNWSRAHRADGRTAVLYDVQRRDGSALSLATWFDASGAFGSFDAPPEASLPRTGWGLSPSTRSDPQVAPTVLRQFEDGPFYSRSLVAGQWSGERVTSVHEHLSLARFDRRWVRALLPFRMPRRAR